MTGSNISSKDHRIPNRWDDAKAASLDPVGQLIYRSNLLGSDQRVTNTGGGNTSAKLREADPLTGEAIDVLWVKGSGGDLRTATKANFASLDLGRVKALEKKWDATPTRGPKTAIEDWMVGAYPHCTYNLNPCAASIDTPLHAFMPGTHVDHTHPNSVIAIAACDKGEQLAKEIFGPEIGWVGWQRPGFDLGLKMRAAAKPGMKGLVMGQHGLINWAGSSKECYDLSIALIDKAAAYIEKHDKGEKTFGGQAVVPLGENERTELLAGLLPWLRGKVSKTSRMYGTWDASPSIVRFVCSKEAERLARLGTSCPDHFLRTKIRPLFVKWDPASGTLDGLKKLIEEGLDNYRKEYAEYYARCKRPDSPAMRDSTPTVVLIPGVGLIAWGKTKSESRVTAEFYGCAVEVMRGAEAMGSYIALPEQEAFDIEYWLLEEAKLKRMPPEKEFSRTVAVVVGAGAGIGKAAAHRLAKDGAHIVCADISKEAAQAAAAELIAAHGAGIGVAGTGVSGCGPAIGIAVDVTNRASVRAMIREAVLAYGGIDSVVITAGVYLAPEQGSLPDEQWKKTFEVNVQGAAIVAEEAAKVWKEQALTGSLIITTSVNAVVPKKGSLAYDTSKAAANHLVRELAVELSPFVRVNGVAPATVVEGSTMFPRHRVVDSLRKYGIAFAETETGDELRHKLAMFYAQRTLLKTPITPADQAEAIAFLVSSKAAKTTGQVFSVDGGLHEAFLR